MYMKIGALMIRAGARGGIKNDDRSHNVDENIRLKFGQFG
jgi:hypothetical protein